MASLSTCHLGLWLGWQLLLNLVKLGHQREPHASPELATVIGVYRPAQMFKSNNRIVPNKMCIGWHFSSNKYVYRDAYLALKNIKFVYNYTSYKSNHSSG